MYAQKMDVGTNFLSLGIGPRTSYNAYHTTGMPAVRVSFDHGFKKIGPGVLSLGGSLGYFAEHYKNTYGWWDLYGYHVQTYKANWNYFILAFRVGYYYNFKELIDMSNLNAYAGIGSGLRYHTYNDDYIGPINNTPDEASGAKFHMAAYGGINYFLTKKIAVYTEFGYDISFITLGVTVEL
jgi:hypothetical protein